MEHFFLDTNILIDLVADRKPFAKFAVALFNQAEKKQVKLYASSFSLANMHYVLLKYMKDVDLRMVLHDLSEYLEILPLTKEILKQALKSRNNDFEDQIQLLTAAMNEKISCIITRNRRHFKNAGIEVLGPEQALAKL